MTHEHVHPIVSLSSLLYKGGEVMKEGRKVMKEGRKEGDKEEGRKVIRRKEGRW